MISILKALLSAQLFAVQAAHLRDGAKRATSYLIGMMIAGLLGAVAMGFLTLAGQRALLNIVDPSIALLIIGAVYLALASIVGLITMSSAHRRAQPSLQNPVSNIATAAQSALQGLSEKVQDLDLEGLAQKEGQKLAKQIGPLPLVGIAVLAGYLLARNFDHHK